MTEHVLEGGLALVPGEAAPVAASVRLLQRTRQMVNKDQVKGVAKQAKGAVKEAAGKATGSRKMEAEGKVEKAAGKVQKGAGDVKEKLK